MTVTRLNMTPNDACEMAGIKSVLRENSLDGSNCRSTEFFRHGTQNTQYHVTRIPCQTCKITLLSEHILTVQYSSLLLYTLGSIDSSKQTYSGTKCTILRNSSIRTTEQQGWYLICGDYGLGSDKVCLAFSSPTLFTKLTI